MKKIAYIMMIFLGVSAIVGTSCSRNVFDIDTYDSLIEIKSPVDTVDPNHTWTLSSSRYIIVSVNAEVGAKKLQILTADPVTSSAATILTQRTVTEGDRFSMNVSVPSYLSTLYAALVDGDGKYTVTRVSSSERDIDFSSPLYKSQTVSHTPLNHYYAFCFEQEFPEPGDYDYNDVILHIAMEHSAADEIKFHVRLAAVGADKALAGCLRFPDMTMEDIDTVYTEGDKSFNKDQSGTEIPKQNRSVTTNTDLLLEGRSGEPILNLFVDAHWATGEIQAKDTYGIFNRKKYNVSYGSSTTTQEYPPREITYVVKFKDASRLNYLTMEDIDPFLMRYYGNAIMEIHTYKYRKDNALKEFKYVDVEHLPWALVIPIGEFFHPLDGVNIGFRMKSEYTHGVEVLYGAYATSGHSFGEWSVNRNKATDWYLQEYASSGQVFVW